MDDWLTFKSSGNPTIVFLYRGIYRIYLILWRKIPENVNMWPVGLGNTGLLVDGAQKSRPGHCSRLSLARAMVPPTSKYHKLLDRDLKSKKIPCEEWQWDLGRLLFWLVFLVMVFRIQPIEMPPFQVLGPDYKVVLKHRKQWTVSVLKCTSEVGPLSNNDSTLKSNNTCFIAYTII